MLVDHLNNIAEDLSLTKKKIVSDKNNSINQYLPLTAGIRTGLEDAFETRFINLEASIKETLI